MADNGKCFKVWTSILADPNFQALSLDQIGRWVASSGPRAVLKACDECRE
jgi:hypothetical protein